MDYFELPGLLGMIINDVGHGHKGLVGIFLETPKLQATIWKSNVAS